MSVAGGGWNAPRAAAGMVAGSAGSVLFVPGPLESETRVYKKWSGVFLGGERVSRHFAKCLEGVRRDGRRATTFRGMSAGGEWVVVALGVGHSVPVWPIFRCMA